MYNLTFVTLIQQTLQITDINLTKPYNHNAVHKSNPSSPCTSGALQYNAQKISEEY
jgi:hypothetical protein